MTLPIDSIWPGEEFIEQNWKETRGIQKESGKMWLTPRQERVADNLVKVWAEQDKDESAD
jgi:hypothetical protein